MVKILQQTAAGPGPTSPSPSARNIRLYPWLKATQSLLFWQSVWFLFFQHRLSAAEAVLIYAIYDIATTILELPSGVASDRLGRRVTLCLSGVFLAVCAALHVIGNSFPVFLLAQLFLGASIAFSSGTDTSILYESLLDEGREGEVETQELLAWRATFAALAFSAVIGGAASLYWDKLPYVFTTISACLYFWLALQMSEPQSTTRGRAAGFKANLSDLTNALRHPALTWLLVLGVAMYAFSHVPFVFGQPLILDTLSQVGLQGQTPLISGCITALMMGIAVLASIYAQKFRHRLGLGFILLTAFGVQIFIVFSMALVDVPWLLFLILMMRMVPNSLSQPFVQASMQGLLATSTRATYLSLRSLMARISFSAMLWVASRHISDTGIATGDQLDRILFGFTVFGVILFVGLFTTSKTLEDKLAQNR